MNKCLFIIIIIIKSVFLEKSSSPLIQVRMLATFYKFTVPTDLILDT